MNWTEKQHGNIKLIHYKNFKRVALMIRGIRQTLLTYEEFEELREVIKEIGD